MGMVSALITRGFAVKYWLLLSAMMSSLAFGMSEDDVDVAIGLTKLVVRAQQCGVGKSNVDKLAKKLSTKLAEVGDSDLKVSAEIIRDQTKRSATPDAATCAGYFRTVVEVLKI